MAIPPFLVVRVHFRAWLGLTFSFDSKTRLSTAIKKGKIPPSPALSGTFWRLNVETPQLAGVKKLKLCNFTTSSFGSSKSINQSDF